MIEFLLLTAIFATACAYCYYLGKQAQRSKDIRLLHKAMLDGFLTREESNTARWALMREDDGGAR